MRLAKFLAHGGVASRRKAEEIVAKGVVTVGGEVVTDPARDVAAEDDVRVNGEPVGAEATEVWAVNKPAGVVSTAREPGRGRRWSSWSTRRRACTRSAASTPTRPACCC